MKKVLVYVLLAVMMVMLAGCTSLNLSALTGGGGSSRSSSPAKAAGSSNAEAMTISGIANNTETKLQAGTYKGLTIDSNSVVLTGSGADKTIISGNVIIKKNNCVIRNLTIRGDVVIEGNNADLTKARIQGNVDSKGKNNSW